MSKAILKFHGLTPAQKLARAREIVAKMTGNTNFTNPTPSLASISAAIDDAEKALEAAGGGGPISKKDRNNKVALVVLLMTQLTSYINAVTDDPVKLLTTGLTLKTEKKRGKRVFRATPGKKAGTVAIEAPPNKARAHKWQYGYDPDTQSNVVPANIVWLDLPITSASHTAIENLTTGHKVWIRHGYVYSGPKGGDYPYGDPVSVIVP